MADSPDYSDIVKRGIAEARNFFRDAFDNATQGTPEWIRNGQPGSLTGKAAQAATRRQCEVWGKNPGAFRPAWGDQLAGICGPYLEDKGLTPPVPSARFPFPGGQCNGRYIVTGTYVKGCPPDVGSTQSWSSFSSVQGPITGLVGSFGGNWLITTANGSTAPIFPSGGGGQLARGPGGGFQCGQFPDPSLVASSASITAVTPVGFTDDCGNPDVDFDPGNGYPQPLPPPPRLIPGDPNSPGFDVTVSPDGTVTVCSEDTCVVLEPGPNGEYPQGEPGSGEGGIAPGDQGTAGNPVIADEDLAAGEDPEANLVGVRVVLTRTPPRASKFFNPTEGYYKGAYFVFFGGEGGFSMETGAQIVKVDQFFYAPPGCNRWRVVANLGYRLTATPYYKED